MRLVLLAAIICMVASFTTLNLLARLQTAGKRQGRPFLFAAAAVFGGGVWSLHFVAMLAFQPNLPIAYDIGLTAASVLMAAFGALLAFSVWQWISPGWTGTAAGGALLGLSVAGMHYAGITAMQIAGRVDVDPGGVAASVATAVSLGMVALARSDQLTRLGRRLEVTGWLSLAICGLHFTGMSALIITPGLGGVTPAPGSLLASGSLAVVVGSVSVVILLLGLAATMIERRLWQRTLESERLRRLASVVREGIIIHQDGVILEVNDAICRMLGVGRSALVGQHVLCSVSPRSTAMVTSRLETPVGDLQPVEVEMLTGDLRPIPTEVICQPLDINGRACRAIALRDLSDRKRHEARIRRLAEFDTLTDLPNRALLQERLGQALEEARRHGTEVAVLYLDLDRFKPVNDTLGHAAGDALLQQVARRLTAELRATDTLARVGGDEFVIVAPAERAQVAAAFAERLVAALDAPFHVQGRFVEIGVSIGVACFPDDAADAEELIRRADVAMYQAKHGQGGPHRFFETEMNDAQQRRLRLEQDLRHAVDRGELLLHYQPLIDARTGRLDGYEALLRWDHPQFGWIPPDVFIPLAEETRVIIRIGHWVLEEACKVAARWPEKLRLAVNLSPVQLREAELPAIVVGTLNRTGLAPGRLEVEMTESILIDDTSRATVVLMELQALGVRIVLDDFGTGYSSLSYLHRFKFDKLKIDKSFIHGLGCDEEAKAIVRAIVGLGHNLGLTVTAEGVETEAQLAALRSFGCDQVQGYLLGRPAPSEWTVELAQLA